MGNNSYSGGSSLLNDRMEFTSFDPAAEQRVTIIRAERAYGPVRPSVEYNLQIIEQMKILLRKIAVGERDIYVPRVFEEETSCFRSLIDWANSKPEFQEIKEKLRAQQKDIEIHARGKKRRRPRKTLEPAGGTLPEKAKQEHKPRPSQKKKPEQTRYSGEQPKNTSHFIENKTPGLSDAARKLNVSESELQRRIAAVRLHNQSNS